MLYNKILEKKEGLKQLIEKERTLVSSLWDKHDLSRAKTALCYLNQITPQTYRDISLKRVKIVKQKSHYHTIT